MAEPFMLEWGDVKRSINAVQERLENPKPALRQFSRYLTKDIRDNIASGGSGWPPYAASTIKRMEGAGTSQISKRGTIRKTRITRVVKQLDKLLRQVRDNGWGPDSRKKYDRLKKRVDNFKKAEAANDRRATRGAAAKATVEGLAHAANTKDLKKFERAKKVVEDSKKDRLGKRVSGRRQLLKGIIGTIRNKLDGNILITYSKADEVGVAHNEGQGHEPKREFLPPPNMDKNLDYLAELLESDLGQAWETGRGK